MKKLILLVVLNSSLFSSLFAMDPYSYWLNQQAQYNQQQQYEQWCAWQNYQAQCAAQQQWQQQQYNQWCYQQWLQQQHASNIQNQPNQYQNGSYQNKNQFKPNIQTTRKPLKIEELENQPNANTKENKQEAQAQNHQIQVVPQEPQANLQQLSDQEVESITVVQSSVASLDSLYESRSRTSTPDFEVQFAANDLEADVSDEILTSPVAPYAEPEHEDKQKEESESESDVSGEALAKMDEAFNEVVQQEVKKEKISKHQKEKQKKLLALQRRLEAKKNKQRASAAKSKLENSAPIEVQEADQGSIIEVQIEQSQIEEQQEESNLPIKEKKDLRLHAAIIANKPIELIESLICKENLSNQDLDGNYAWHIAAIAKNIKALTKIIEKLEEYITDDQEFKKLINEPNKYGFTALYYAVVKKDFAIVNYLLSKGADRNLLPEKIQNRLIAMAQEHKKQLEDFMKSPSVEQEKKENEANVIPPSMVAQTQNFLKMFESSNHYADFLKAIVAGKIKEVKKFVKKYPQIINFKDGDLFVALHSAVINDSKRNNFEVTKFLTEQNPEHICSVDRVGFSPFHYAISFGNIEICKYFISIAKRYNIENIKAGVLVLIRFGQSNCGEEQNKENIEMIVKLLQKYLKEIELAEEEATQEIKFREEKAAYLNRRNVTQEQNSLNKSNVTEQPNRFAKFNSQELGQMLFTYVKHYVRLGLDSIRSDIIEIIKAGADLTKKDIEGATCLHVFSARNDDEIVKLLLKKGADPMATDDNDDVSLHYAAANKALKVIPLLIAANSGCKNAVDKHGNTPLHLSTRHIEVVKLLILLGVDTQIKNKKKLTPYLESIIHKYSSYDPLSSETIKVMKGKGIVKIVRDVCDAIDHDTENKIPQLREFKSFLLRNRAKEAGLIDDNSTDVVVDIIWHGPEEPELILIKQDQLKDLIDSEDSSILRIHADDV